MIAYKQFCSKDEVKAYIIRMIENEKNSKIEIRVSVSPDETYWKEILKDVILSNEILQIEKYLNLQKLPSEEGNETINYVFSKPVLAKSETCILEYFEIEIYFPDFMVLCMPYLSILVLRKWNMFEKIIKPGIDGSDYWKYDYQNNSWTVAKIPISVT